MLARQAARRCAALSRATHSTLARGIATHVMGEEFKCFRLDGDDEGVAVFTMDRPSARNALGRQMMKEMREALQWAESSSEVRVVVLESAVERVFCAGADLKERATMTPEEAQAFVKGLRDGFSALAAARMPTIAAIEGAALGGGLELAMSCDLRVAGDAAMVGLPETGLAIIPGAGGTQRLPRLVGQARAKELIFTGRRVGAEEALQLGIVEFAVEKGAARGVQGGGPRAVHAG